MVVTIVMVTQWSGYGDSGDGDTGDGDTGDSDSGMSCSPSMADNAPQFNDRMVSCYPSVAPTTITTTARQALVQERERENVSFVIVCVEGDGDLLGILNHILGRMREWAR